MGVAVHTGIGYGAVRPFGRSVTIQVLLGDIASQVPQRTTDAVPLSDFPAQITSGVFGGEEAWLITDLRYTLAEADALDFLSAQSIFEAKETWSLVDHITATGQPTDGWGVNDHAGFIFPVEQWSITDTATKT
jgi:hypothetical protein